MEILRMSDCDTLLRASWAYATSGAEVPTLGLKPGGNGPALIWSNGAYIYLDAFGNPVTSGTPPVSPDPVPPASLAEAAIVSA